MTQARSAPPTTLLLDASNMICMIFNRKSTQALSVSEARDRIVREIKNSIRALRHRYNPEFVLAALDHEQNFRRELDPDYKGRRKHKSSVLKALLKGSAEIMWEAGALPFYAYGFEADDVLATLAAHAPGRTIICTNDSDLKTVVSSRVQLHCSPWEEVNEQQVERQHALKPAQIVLYKALVGDSKDNFVGVKHLSHPQALRLARRFHDMSDLLDHLDLISEPVQGKLRAACAERLQRNYQLCKLAENAPVQPALPADHPLLGAGQ